MQKTDFRMCLIFYVYKHVVYFKIIYLEYKIKVTIYNLWLK